MGSPGQPVMVAVFGPSFSRNSWFVDGGVKNNPDISGISARGPVVAGY